MHRRQFLAAATAAVIAPRFATAQSPAASPAADPGLKITGHALAISPDGTKIASIAENGQSIWITDLASSEAVQSDEVDLRITLPSVVWAPDSSAVAFSLDAPVFLRDSDIYVVDAETGALTDLTNDDPDDTGADEISISDTSASNAVPIDLFPAWSPDSKNLVFARTVWSDQPGTTLTTIPRDGGTPSERFTLQKEYPMAVYSPMWWLDNDAILLAQWMSSPDHEDNGIWRLDPDDTFTQLVSGDLDAGIPGASIADVTADGSRASVYSQLLLNQYGYSPETAPGIWFDVDLTTGALEPWEPALGLATEPTEQLKTDGDGRLVAPPVFAPDDQSIAFMTRAANGPIQVSIMADSSSPEKIATFEPAEANPGGGPIGYRLQWADNGAIIVLTPAGLTGILRP